MKVLVIDQGAYLLSMCCKAMSEGHDVRVWTPPTAYHKPTQTGRGLLHKVNDWRSHIRWADLIIVQTSELFARELKPLYNQGYPVFGPNPEGARMELDRGHGQELCQQAGIATIPYKIFTSYDDAAAYVKKMDQCFVCKPWGGTDDKSLTYVASSPDDLVWTLLYEWKKKGPLKGKLMLQEKIKGIEMAVGGWFGPGGWSPHLCENFEHKKLMNDDLGENTGEQGTVLYYTSQSRLFEQTLAPLTGHLHRTGYVGYVDQNCIIDNKGNPWPLEFTMRFGYPLRDIQESLHLGDSMEWKLNLLQGRNTLQVKDKVALGVVVTHGKYPNDKPDNPENDGLPLYGISEAMKEHIHFRDVRIGRAPLDGKEQEILCTTGDYIGTIVGVGNTVQDAAEKAYTMCKKVSIPSNKMYRTDIGKRLDKQLDILHKQGYAKGIEYE